MRRDQGIHTVPVNDLVPHQYSTSCWCLPAIETSGRIDLISHNAMDGRDRPTMAS